MQIVRQDTCSRRTLLKLAAKGIVLGAAGLSLPNLLFLREAAGVELDRNLQLFDGFLQIFFNGGPSIGQDVADYKDPTENPTTAFNPIDLGVNDVYNSPIRVTDAIQNLAAKVMSDPAVSLAILRSMRHGLNDHRPAQRRNTSWWQEPEALRMPAIAPTFAHYLGGRGIGIPAVVLSDPRGGGRIGDGGNATRGNPEVPAALEVTLGQGPGSDPVVQALRLPPGVDAARYRRRRAMAEKLNARFLAKSPDAVAKAYAKATQDAYDVTLKGEAATAFELAGKPLLPGGNTAIRERATVAKNLLLSGVPYVTFGIGQNDAHGNTVNTIRTNWQENLDVFLPAMLDALKASGKRFLIQVCGDFDRTPDGKGQFLRGAGRDHWGEAQTHLLFGVNQSKLKTTAVGDTGPRGLGTLNETRRGGVPGGLRDPFPMGALGYVIYRSMGINLFQPDGAFDLPTAQRDTPPVDRHVGLTEGVELSNHIIA